MLCCSILCVLYITPPPRMTDCMDECTHLLSLSSCVHRSVRNVVTGIDASVPSFEKTANPRDVQHYHVLVVTSKTNVKSGEHTADEVVQFMVRMWVWRGEEEEGGEQSRWKISHSLIFFAK